MLAFAEIVRLQRHVLPERSGRLRRWAIVGLRRLLKRPGRDVRLGLAPATAGVSANLGLEVQRGPATGIEQRIARLEAEMGDLRRKQAEDKDDFSDRLAATNQRITDLEVDLQRQLNEADAARRKEVSDSLLLQYVGIFIVGLGIVLSTLGNTVTC